MGKYPPSKIHDWFSKWHYEECKKGANLTDVDRFWVEVREEKLRAVFDLKWFSVKDTELPRTEIIVLQFFERHNVPAYIVRIALTEPPEFWVRRLSSSHNERMNERRFKSWINKDLPPGWIQTR